MAILRWMFPVVLVWGCAASDTDDATDTDTDADADADADTDTDTDTDESCGSPTWDAADFEHVFDVGPGEEFEDPSQVPWEALEPSTLVRIHSRAEPYNDKWVITTRATESAPLVVLGVGDPLPVISGEGAKTRLELDYWNENRSIIKIGGFSVPSSREAPAHVWVQNLDLRDARAAQSFTDDGGSTQNYSDNAACIHVEQGEHITLVGNDLHACGNGLFAGSDASDLRVVGNHLWDNGNIGSAYEHNSYTEALGITFEYNLYGPPCDGCDGNNLKDRSAGTVIRYNWLEGGNRQLDLVDAGEPEIINDPSYHDTWVVGNVMVEREGDGNSQIVHYGGDGGDTSDYRPGTLHLVHNTVLSTRTGNTTLLRLSTAAQVADVRNNVIVAGSLAITAGSGVVDLADNWISEGWRDTFESAMDGEVNDLGNLEGDDPGLDAALVPTADSPLRDAAGDLTTGTPTCHYVQHQRARTRPSDGADDIGAYEGE